MPFCPETERWERTRGTGMPFCPRDQAKTFVLGQKSGTGRTERTGTRSRWVLEFQDLIQTFNEDKGAFSALAKYSFFFAYSSLL